MIASKTRDKSVMVMQFASLLGRRSVGHWVFPHFTHVFQLALFFEGLFDPVVFVVVPDMVFVASVSKFLLGDKIMAVLLKHSFQFL